MQTFAGETFTFSFYFFVFRPFTPYICTTITILIYSNHEKHEINEMVLSTALHLDRQLGYG